MADTKTINTLKKLAAFGTSIAAENAYNEYKTEKDTLQFENNLKSLLPEVMDETNTNPQKMASAYSVNAANSITSNLDTNLRNVTSQAGNFAGLDPQAYNKKLATDLLPSLQTVRGLKGAERSVAMSRFQDQVKAAQATHMKANKQYIQTQTRNTLSNNINTTIDNVLKDTRNFTPQQRTERFDQQLVEILAVSREKGLPDLDAQKLINDVFIGKISSGDVTAEALLTNSKFRSFINPETLRTARLQGEKKYLDRFTAGKASGMLTKKQERQIFDERITKAIEEGKDLPQIVAQDHKYVMGLSNGLFNEMLLAKSNEVTLTGDPSKDSTIQDTRNQITQTISALRGQGYNAQVVKNKLDNRTNHLGSVIDAVYGGVADEWADYDKKATVGAREAVQPGYEKNLTNNIGVVRNSIATRLKNYGDDSWLGPIGEKWTDRFRGLAAPFSDKYMYARNVSRNGRPEDRVLNGDYNTRIIADMGRYESLIGKVDWSDEDQVEDFVNFTYRFDALGGTTVFTNKGSDTFSGTFDRQDTDKYIKEAGDSLRKQFLEKYTPDNPERYENRIGSSTDMITYEVNPMNNRMKIFINRFENEWDRDVTGKLTPQRIEGMWRMDLDENGDYTLELLDKDKYEYAQKSPVFATQLENEGWRNTSIDGAIELDPRQFKAWGNGQLQREGRAKREQELRKYNPNIIATPIGVIGADATMSENLGIGTSAI